MGYKESKSKLIEARENLFKEYKNLYTEALKISTDVSLLQTKIKNSLEAADFELFLSEDLEMQKLTRLIISLLYIENPTNREIIDKLKDDICFSEEDLKKISKPRK